MKRIIIIGASSGIGRKLAEDFAAKEWQVGIAARREDRLREIVEKHPENMVCMPIDVTAQEAPEQLFDLISLNGGCDVFLYASGVGFANPGMESVLDQRIMAVNVVGFTRLVNAAYKYFASQPRSNSQPGRIAAITSIGAVKGLGYAAAYSASKSYQQKYLQAVAQLARMQQVPVRVTDIRPGFVRTDLLDPKAQYPLTMAVNYAAPLIEKAIEDGKRIAVVDIRWRLVASLWSLIPDGLWTRLPIQL